MGGITIAWLIGEGIICWREVAGCHRPPMPGALIASSVIFAGLAVLAEYQPARTAATLMAFGLDIAAWLKAPYITSTCPQATAKAAKVPARPGGGGVTLQTAGT